jgi:hypothetical protein
MSIVNAGVSIRIECGLPALPDLGFGIPWPPTIDLKWPPTFNFNFSLTIKCPELPLDFLDKINQALGSLKIKWPKIPPIDLAQYGLTTGAAVTFNGKAATEKWTYESY